MARDYQRENKYKAQPEQIKARVERNKARKMMMDAGKVKKGDGMEVDHIKPVSKGGKTVMANLRVLTASANDSFKRNSKRQLVSQTSDRERGKAKKR
jgi:5-methylcytosine-specific restriction endonuclease McrA